MYSLHLKSVLFKNVLGKIAWPTNSQKLPRWNEWNQRGSFCEFLGHAIFPSTFLNKTDFSLRHSSVCVMFVLWGFLPNLIWILGKIFGCIISIVYLRIDLLGRIRIDYTGSVSHLVRLVYLRRIRRTICCIYRLSS